MNESAEQQGTTRAMAPPFKALIAGWSLIVVVLSVAGYSFRWNYYYNFGVESLVFSASLQSLPLYAIEMLRNLAFLWDLVRFTLLYLLPFQAAMLLLKLARDARNARIRQSAQLVTRVLALDNRLLIEGVTAALILLVAFRAGGNAGYQAYLRNVSESSSTLPKVTLIARADSAESVLPISCDTRPLKDRGPVIVPRFFGDRDAVDSLAAGLACSSEQWSWRLLLRDEKFLYLFATVRNTNQRPQTIILPNNESVTVALR